MGAVAGRREVAPLAAGAVLAALLWLVTGIPVRADGVVRGFYFYSPECGHCQAVASEVLPKVQARFGPRLELRMFDIREPRNNDLLVALEARYGLKEVSLPELFVGTDVLVGEEAIRVEMASLIEKHLAAGGVDFPTQDVPVPVAAPTPGPAAGSAPVVNLAYFYRAGCGKCERAAYDLAYLRGRYPGLRVTEFDISGQENALVYEVLAEGARIPASRRLLAPAVFVGGEALVGEEVTRARLEDLVGRYEATGAGAAWRDLTSPGASAELGRALRRILGRFQAFGPLVVAGAGLIDGLNPCAFAAIVFFVSYLAFMGRSRREMLLVGGAFTLGVFAAYLLVGLGVLRLAATLSGYRIAGRVVYGLMAGLCLAFAGLSVHDSIKARRGEPEAMRLRLPRFLRQRVHQVIRQGSRRSAFVAAAGLTGLVVSLLELACTGQGYLPTIMFVLGQPQMRPHAVPYLVLYNLFFVVPLIVVFTVAALGVNSSRLAGLVQKHTGGVKLLTAVVFAGLGFYLLSVAL